MSALPQNMDKDTNYYSNLNAQLLAQIPPQCKHVLEVGCGTGVFGAEYKRQNPASAYYGIEMMEEPAKQAAQNLDKVIHDTVENVALSAVLPEGELLDCIVYGDVLEHLMFPWDVLKAHKQWLKPGGVAVACVPNVQFWSVLRDLMAGQWNYTDSGVMDVTHIRFFTLDSLVRCFRYAGFSVDGVTTRKVSTAQGSGDMTMEEFIQLATPLAERMKLDMNRWKMQLHAFQYIVVGKAQENLMPQPTP